MNLSATRNRPSKAARASGHTIAAVLNTVLLYLVNVRPGWSAVPFLTGDTPRVLLLFNLSLLVGIALNLGYAAYDAPRWKALGDLVTDGLGLAVLVRVWTVFPFAFDGPEWTLVARTVLVFAMAGITIAMLVHAAAAIRRT